MNLKNSTKSQKFSYLENFLSVEISYFFQTSCHFFTKFQFEFEKTQNMRVVACETSFPKCPRTLKSMESSYTFEIENIGLHKLDFQSSKLQIIGHFVIS